MSLTLIDVRRIAVDVAKEQDPALEVVGVTPAGGEGPYTEVILTVRGCQVEPCRIIIGISRDTSESACRGAVSEHLRQHLDEHRATKATR